MSSERVEVLRVERDFLGEKKIPADAYYGIHTARAKENFPITIRLGYRIHPELIRAFAMVKKACALALLQLGYMEEDKAKAIVQACDELIEGKWHDQIIVDPFQGGAGTSLNMNVNEVIANRASEILGRKVHPLDDVNRMQSTNDTFPTAARIAAIFLLRQLTAVVGELQQALEDKEKEFAGVLKLGRTEMQDAVPITLGQEFSAYAEAIARDRWRLYKVEERLRQVNLGGTAVGTGLNADLRYIHLVIQRLRDISGLNLAKADNLIDPTQNWDIFAEVHGLLKALAVNLYKISNDLILMSAFKEIQLPAVQAGSSIMPGKVNPVILECVKQVAVRVMANDVAINMASSHGQFELNALAPLIVHCMLESLEILTNAVEVMIEKCVRGIKANEEVCRMYLERSPALITPLAPYLGYDKASEIAKEAVAKGKTIRDVLLEKGLFSDEELEVLLSPQELVKPGIAGEGKIDRKIVSREYKD
jgi:aspartate ammonia-lyase